MSGATRSAAFLKNNSFGIVEWTSTYIYTNAQRRLQCAKYLASKSYIENLFLVHFIISIKSISVSEMQHRTHRAQSGKGCLLLLENSKFCGEQETTSFRCHWRQAPYKWAIYRWQLQMERTVLRTTKIVPAAALSILSSYYLYMTVPELANGCVQSRTHPCTTPV